MSIANNKCALHPAVLITHFCESCKDLVCQTCIEKQPHSGASHQIKPLSESANLRRNYYMHYLSTEVNPMRERIEDRLVKIEEMKE